MFQAMVTAFAAEESLPFSLVPKIVELAKELAKDTEALAHMKLGDRTTASYKTTYG